MARELETAALLLRSVDYGEADKVCTLLTAERGKIAAFARGARGSKRRFRGGLGSFVELHVTLRAARGEGMAKLAESEAATCHTAIGSDLVRMAAGTHALELVELSLHDEQGAELFGTVLRFVRWLAAEERGVHYVEAGLHRLQLILLQTHGLLPDMGACARSGDALEDAASVCWLPDVGLVARDARHAGEPAAELSASTLRYLRGVAHGHFPESDSPAIRHDARRALRYVWQHILGRELKSWGFYDGTVG